MNRQFSKEGIQMANKYMGKIFSTFSHQGNASQNYKIPFQPSQNDYH
jgi:hypothetical protein